ncbi:Non-motile and phage-resistance protein [compost metagenome]
MKQVMQRLIHNAAKFGLEGTEIGVSTEVSGKSLRFIVTNKGSQIPSSIMDKITKPFYIDEDVMHHSTGTGLGLTICQSILKVHHSTLQFKNTIDGVEVFFDLPLGH